MHDISYSHGLDLENMDWPDAVKEARSRCTKTNDLIASEFSKKLGLSKPYPMSTVQRWFNSNDRHYWPSAEYVPTICSVLGNYILIAWMMAQARQEAHDGQILTMEDLREFLPAIMQELGRVGTALQLVSAEGGITPKASRGVRGALFALISLLGAFAKRCNPIARKKSLCAH